MIVPSIDLAFGQTVQLIGGKQHALDAGPPQPLAELFGRVGEVAVIDLDAALGRGTNAALIDDLLPRARCRVGGGIRSVATALRWLDAGAHRIILGTAATPEILRELPKERLIAALDANFGEVVVEGWQKGTGRTVPDRMAELQPYVDGFLVTFVEREGRLGGIDLEQVKALKKAAGAAHLTIAGGISTVQELAALDALGIDAQVGMALYTGRFDLADALAAMLKSDRADGLWPTVVADEMGVALGLAYSSLDSLRQALATGKGVYHSRSRGGIWVKGASSGATQALQRVDLDCDRDTLRFTVRQEAPGFCHHDTATCWGPHGGIAALADALQARRQRAPTGSYTQRLLQDPQLLASKLQEEACELATASEPSDVAHEAADVLYFMLVALSRASVPLWRVAAVLDRRALRVSRRRGDAKPPQKGKS